MELLKFLKRSNRASISFIVTANRETLLQHKHLIQVSDTNNGFRKSVATCIEYNINNT